MTFRFLRSVSLAAALVAVLAIAVPTTIYADPPPPGAGIDGLMPPPDLRHGNQPTLAEKYSPLAYGLNLDLGSAAIAFFQNPTAEATNGVANGVASIGMTIVVIEGVITTRLLEWSFTIDLVDALSGPISGEIGALHLGIYLPLIEMVIFLAGLAVLWHAMRLRMIKTVSELLWIILAVTLAAFYFADPVTVVGGVNRFGADVSREILASTAQVDIAGRGNDPTMASGSPSDAELRQFADREWRTFIFVPYSVVLLGSVNQAPLAEEYLKKQSGQSNNFDSQFQQAPQWNKDWFNGRNGGDRVAYTFIAWLVVTLTGLLIVFLAGIILVAQLALTMLMGVAPLFLLVAPLPGAGRALMKRWIVLAMGPFALRILFSFLLATVMVLGNAINNGIGRTNWVVAALLQIALVIAAIWWRKPFVTIFSQLFTGRWAHTVGQHRSGAVASQKAHEGMGRAQQWLGQVQARAGQAGARTAAGAQRAATAGPAGMRAATQAASTGARAASVGTRVAAAKGVGGWALRGAAAAAGPAALALGAGMAVVRAHERGKRHAQGLAGHFVLGPKPTVPQQPPMRMPSNGRGPHRPLTGPEQQERRGEWRQASANNNRRQGTPPRSTNGQQPGPRRKRSTQQQPSGTRVNINPDGQGGFKVGGSGNATADSINFASRGAAEAYASMHGWSF